MVEKVSDSAYTWILGGERYPGTYISEIFSICDDRHHLNFRLLKFTRHSWNLLLCKSHGISLKVDVHVLLRYKDEEKHFSVKNFHVKLGTNNLAIIRANGLTDITCTFLNIPHPIKTVTETDEKDKNEELEQGLMKVTKEDEDTDDELNEGIKQKGLAALSANLEDVFLSEEDSDFVLKVGDQKYPVHRVILRARCPVFQAMLKHDMKEKNEGVVDIPDCHPYIFRDFLFFLYTAKRDNISKENVFELYHMSEKYDIQELKEYCLDFIVKNLTVDIIVDVISLASKYCEHDLLADATAFFVDNAKDILVTINWQKFVQEFPIQANELFLKIFHRLSEK